MKIIYSILVLQVISLSMVLCSCSKNAEPDKADVGTPNILLIIADDLGKDALNGYTEGSVKAKTPHLDELMNSGLTFQNFWANPTCSPTRATIITGKYGYRTGVKNAGDVLGSSEVSLQKYISDNTNHKYATAIIGKWHLSGTNTSINPESFGIDYYAGLIRGALTDYSQWPLTEDGVSKTQTEYATKVITDLAINWVNAQSKPWFLWLAYNAPHTPFHAPPVEMHQQGNLPAYTTGMEPMPYYIASIEAMDYQIGRLLDNIPENEKNNTIIIFIGDNGTTNQVAQSPYIGSKVKGTLYQGGINTPMFVSGSGVTRMGKDDNLLSGTDLFATISELTGVNGNEFNDSKSFKSLLSQPGVIRKFQYSEINDGTTDAWAISNGTYKLIVFATGNKEMFQLKTDPYETKNLLNNNLTTAESAAKTELETELDSIRK